MSAALAAGVAALIRSRFPGLTAAAVVQAMERGVTGRAASGGGHGALDAAGALTVAATLAARQAPPATATPSPQPSVTQAPRRLDATSSAARSGAGILAGSLLRDAVIVLGVLIAALAAALVLYSSRRRGRRRLPASRAPPGRPASTPGGPRQRSRPRRPPSGRHSKTRGAGPASRAAPARVSPRRRLSARSAARAPRGARGGARPGNRRGDPPARRAPRSRLLPLTTCCRRGSWRPAWPRHRSRRSFPSCRRPTPARCTCGTRRRPARCPSSARTRKIKSSYPERARGSSPGPPSSPESLALTSDAYSCTYSCPDSSPIARITSSAIGTPRPGRRLARQVTEFHPLADPDLDPGRPGQRRARRQHLPGARASPPGSRARRCSAPASRAPTGPGTAGRRATWCPPGRTRTGRPRAGCQRPPPGWPAPTRASLPVHLKLVGGPQVGGPEPAERAPSPRSTRPWRGTPPAGRS